MPRSAEVSPRTCSRAVRSSPSRPGVGHPFHEVDVGAQRDQAQCRVDLERERLEDAEQPAQLRDRVASGGGPHRLHQRLGEHHRERHVPAGLDLGRDPAASGDLGPELVEEHRLAHPAAAVEDPAPVALAVRLGTLAHHLEGFEQRLATGEHRRTPARAGAVGVRDRVHDQRLSGRIRVFVMRSDES